MPRRERPSETTRSEHWMRVAVDDPTHLNRCIRDEFKWRPDDYIEWVSPVKSDGYAEYYDQAFLTRLGLDTLAVPLTEFWPTGGPRWDALAKAGGGKVILVEAKAYIEEVVDGGSRATPGSAAKIAAALARTKAAFGSASAGSWESPFYQYVNRLAHLYFLREINGVDAYLVFLNFADAPDVPEPSSELEWKGADRLIRKCLGIRSHRYRVNIATIVQPVSAFARPASS
jgi:hypothetical protein